MKKLKEFFIKLIFVVIFALIVNFISYNDIFNNFIVSIVFDIVITELWFNPKINNDKLIISEICKMKNFSFNEHLYDNFNSLQLNEFKIFIYSSCMFLPYFKKLYKIFPYLKLENTNIKILDIISKFSTDSLYQFILLLFILIIYFLIIIKLKKFSKYHKIYEDRRCATINNYMDINMEYRPYINEYSETELKFLNNGKPLINHSHENNNSENGE